MPSIRKNIYLSRSRQTKVKKGLAALLLSILFISQVGYYFIYTIHQHIIKEKIEKELLTHIPDSSLDVVIAEDWNNKLEWEEEGKEFSLNGEMYDVARIEVKDGKTYLYCINDKKEKEILNNLVKAVNKNHDSKKERNTIKPVLTDMLIVTPVEPVKTFSDSSPYGSLSVSPVSSFKEIISPPPKT
jgi:hypothetical protein